MAINMYTDDEVFQAARVALSGLSLRHQAVSQNMANIDTPGYEAQTVSFEQAVKQVIDEDTSKNLSLAKTSTAHLASPDQSVAGFVREQRVGNNYRADENNVDIEVELMDMNETVMRYETVIQLLAKRYRLYQTVADSK